MSLKMLNSRVGIMGRPTCAGIIFSDNGAIVIDNGWGRRYGQKILDELEALDKKLIAIINTHSHLDHAGANYSMQQATGCDLYMTKFESLMVRGEPQLFASLFGGSMCPINDGLEVFKNLKETSPKIIKADEPVTIDGVTFDIISLPGHSDGHVGIAVDDILFCGDLVMGPDAIKVTKLMFISNPILQRESLMKFKNTSYSLYVPSHGCTFTDPNEAADPVLAMMDRIESLILEKTNEQPVSLDFLLQHVMTNMRLNARSIQTYQTCKTTIHGYVNSMVLKNKLDYLFKDNIMYYKTLKEGEIREALKEKK